MPSRLKRSWIQSQMKVSKMMKMLISMMHIHLKWHVILNYMQFCQTFKKKFRTSMLGKDTKLKSSHTAFQNKMVQMLLKTVYQLFLSLKTEASPYI